MKYLSILAALALLASCTNSENAPGTGDSEQPVPVSLSAGIAPTRVVNDEWTAGDAIGLSLYAAGTTEPASPAVLNYRYLATTTGATTGFSPATTQQTAYYPTTGAQVDLLAYYPYTANPNPDGTLPLDVSLQQSLPAIDLMSATATADKDHPNVALRFSHRLTRLVFSISGKGSVSTASLAGATLTIRGMDTRADYNLHTDTYTTVDTDAGATDDAAGNTSSTTAASGDNNTSPQDISVPLNASGTQGTAIMLPRSAAAGVSFIITLSDGSHFTAHLSVTLKPGAGITSEVLQTATVTVPQAITTYELKGITLTPGTTRADITLSGTRDRRHALLLPQTITAGQPLLRLTIGEQTYRLDATARNGAFEAGKSYTLNVTVSNAEITATVSINPWLTGGDSEGDAGMEI